jgi:hypothetical protein
MQISAPAQLGNSGGPLANVHGQVIGVVTSKLNALNVAKSTGDVPQNVNFAIKDVVVKAFLDANDISYEYSANDQMYGIADIRDLLKKITVQVICS